MQPRRPLFALLLGATLTMACQKDKPPPSLVDLADRTDFAVTPRLPAPASGTYLSFPEEPRDELIEKFLRGKRHDGALASAGAALALAILEDDTMLTRWGLREALWRGGFPYPVYDARSWEARSGDAPPRDLFTWVEAVDETEPMTLVRARGLHGDAWIGIRARPEIDLGALPRRAPPGTSIRVPALPGATYRLTDGAGNLYEGDLTGGEQLLLASAGEWLLEITRDRRELARMPIYVGISPPDEPLLKLPGDPPVIGDAEDAAAASAELLAHVRSAYVLPQWQSDPSLDIAAQKVATAPPHDTSRILEALGYRREDVVVWACDDVTVENCLDRWIWDPRRRKTLFDRDLDTMGLHAELDARGVHLTLLLTDVG
jgi:hypothetical protein